MQIDILKPVNWQNTCTNYIHINAHKQYFAKLKSIKLSINYKIHIELNIGLHMNIIKVGHVNNIPPSGFATNIHTKKANADVRVEIETKCCERIYIHR